MLPFQCNGLRTGDRVLVHNDHAPDLDAYEGIVHTQRGSSNEVCIRIETTGEIVRPSRHAVHQLPLDRRFSCWRCDTVAAEGQSVTPEVIAA